MKERFWAYYPPTDATFEDISSRGIIGLDSSALLHSYRLAPEAADAWLGVLEQLQERVWIPEQAAWEYQRNRLNVVSTHESVLAQVRREIDGIFQQIRDALEKLRPSLERARVLKADDLLEVIPHAQVLFEQPLTAAAEKVVDHRDAVAGQDNIDQRISVIAEGRIGEAYASDRLKEVYDEGKVRFDMKIPPGWRDSDKKVDRRRYGDLIVWCQFIDQAKDQGRPAVLITEDDKDDWWHRPAGRTFGPHPEMREEFHSASGQHMWLYDVASFMRQAANFGADPVDASILETAADYEEPSDVDQDDAPLNDRRRTLTAIVEAIELLESEEAHEADARDVVLARLIAALHDELG